MILMVCMIVSLLVGFTVSAAAEAGIITYTLKEGDTVLKACQKNGIDFYAKQKLIAAINNITDYRSLPVGFTVKLPTDAYVASASTAAAAPAASAGSSAVAVSGAATTANIAAGDTVSYYLIRYQMKSGDTVAGVCNSLGVNFGTYSSMIKDINRIGNWNNVKAGSTILIPSATVPPVGTSCYAVVAHTVASGETATSICASYGMNYGANEALLKAINNKSNLNSIMRGSSFLVPVSTTIKGSGTVPSGSGSSSSSSSGSSSSGGTVNSSSATYSITGEITNPKCNGYVTWEFLLNGKSVTKAAAGEKITIKHVNSNLDYFIAYITVLDNSGKMQVITSTKDKTFVMPASPVKVYFNVQSYEFYDLEVVSSTGGKVSCYVDGSKVTRAREGQVVTVSASADSGYEMQRLAWSNNKSFSTNNVIKDNGTFIMPAAKTYVKADFTKASAHTIYDKTPSSENGTIKFEVGGKKTTNAWGGYTVHVIATPKDGYVLDTIKVYQHDNILYTIAFNSDDNTFVMPGFDVDVAATFKQVKHLIKTSPQFVTGTVVYKVGTEVVSEAAKGDTVTAEVTPSAGYQLKNMYYQYTDSNDNLATKAIPVSGNTGKFTMPDCDVCVFAEFEIVPVTYTVKVLKADGSAIAVNDTYNGIEYLGVTKSSANVGDEITLSAVLNDSYSNSAYYTLENDVNLHAHHEIPFNSPFDMPADNIKIYLVSTPKAYTVKAGSISNGSVRFSDGNEESNSSITSERDETVVVKINPNSDFEYIPGSIVIKNQYDYDLVAGGEITPNTSSLASEGIITFKMPASSVTVTVKYRRQIHELPDLSSTNFEYRVMVDGKLVKLSDSAIPAKYKDDKYANTDYSAGNGKFYYNTTIFVYYTGGTFDKDAHTFKAWDKVGNPYNPANGIGTNEVGYYFAFNADMVKPAKIEVS